MGKEFALTTRRDILKALAATSALPALGALPAVAVPRSPESGFETTDPLKWVNVFVGTGGHGHCFPGATVPFGSVQLSPDTY